MSDELYEKIVAEAIKYQGEWGLETFSPVGTGEPFCDPKLMDRIKLARRVMPNFTTIRIFTNGSLITRKDIDELARMGNIEIYVSLNGASKETRYKLMGLNDFEVAKGNLDYMRAVGLKPKAAMVWFPTLTAHELMDFAEIENSIIIRFQSFAGESYRYRRTVPTMCNRVLEYMTVLWDGRVNLCCFDAFGKVIFGDLNQQTLKEVWDSSHHRQYLKAHLENRGQEMRLCRNCTEGA